MLNRWKLSTIFTVAGAANAGTMSIDYVGQQQPTGTRISRIRVSPRIAAACSEMSLEEEEFLAPLARGKTSVGRTNQAFCPHLRGQPPRTSIRGDVNFLSSSQRDASLTGAVCTSVAAVF